MAKQPPTGLPNGVPNRYYADCTRRVRQAYADVAAQHDPKVGNDAVTFGISVGRAVWYRLDQQFVGHPTVKVLRPENSFELAVGLVTFRPFKLGDTTLDNVWSSFPYNTEATGRMASINVTQLHIPAIGQPLHYVLGHFGNPQSGFAMLYLCVPITDRSGRVISWSTAVRIDTLGMGGAGTPVGGPKPLPRPPVRLRPTPLVSESEHEGESSPSSGGA